MSIDKKDLESILDGFLIENKVGGIYLQLILNSKDLTPKKIERNYVLLKSKGFTDEKLAKRASLLARDPSELEYLCNFLSNLGVSDKKLVTNCAILGKKIDKIESSYEMMKDFGFTDKKIAVSIQVLGRNQEKIKKSLEYLCTIVSKEKILTHINLTTYGLEKLKENYDFLYHKIGLSRKRIDTFASLLSRDQKSILRNYKLLKKIIKRDSKIRALASLLGRNPDTLQANYYNLKRLGFNEVRIATNSELLSMNQKTIESRFKMFLKMGIKYERILQYPKLLGIRPEKIKKNFNYYKRLGVKDSSICLHPYMLSRNLDKMQENYEYLMDMGVPHDKLMTSYYIIGKNMKNYQRNYEQIIRFFKTDYQDRTVGKGILMGQPQIIAHSPKTIEANVQFSSLMDIDIHKNKNLYMTYPSNKRKKMAVILREVFEYRSVPDDKKKGVILDMCNFLDQRPHILSKSESAIYQKIDRLKKSAEKILGKTLYTRSLTLNPKSI